MHHLERHRAPATPPPAALGILEVRTIGELWGLWARLHGLTVTGEVPVSLDVAVHVDEGCNVDSCWRLQLGDGHALVDLLSVHLLCQVRDTRHVCLQECACPASEVFQPSICLPSQH